MSKTFFNAADKRTGAGNPELVLCRQSVAIAFLVILGLAGFSSQALAQQKLMPTGNTPADARTRYDERVRTCGEGLPRPEYEACIRAAGVALDRTGVAASGTKPMESSDGRAKIYVAPGTSPPPAESSELAPKTVTSRDGRATLLVPSDSTLRSTHTNP